MTKLSIKDESILFIRNIIKLEKWWELNLSREQIEVSRGHYTNQWVDDVWKHKSPSGDIQDIFDYLNTTGFLNYQYPLYTLSQSKSGVEEFAKELTQSEKDWEELLESIAKTGMFVLAVITLVASLK